MRSGSRQLNCLFENTYFQRGQILAESLCSGILQPCRNRGVGCCRVARAGRIVERNQPSFGPLNAVGDLRPWKGDGCSTALRFRNRHAPYDCEIRLVKEFSNDFLASDEFIALTNQRELSAIDEYRRFCQKLRIVCEFHFQRAQTAGPLRQMDYKSCLIARTHYGN